MCIRPSEDNDNAAASTSTMESSSSSSWWNGLGGTVHGSFFRVSDKVDVNKAPGTTSLWIQKGTREEQTVKAAFWSWATLEGFLYSTQSLLFVLGVSLYYCFPYQLDEPEPYMDTVWKRGTLNFCVCAIYTTFWHVALFGWELGQRPFTPNRVYNVRKVRNNNNKSTPIPVDADQTMKKR